MERPELRGFDAIYSRTSGPGRRDAPLLAEFLLVVLDPFSERITGRLSSPIVAVTSPLPGSFSRLLLGALPGGPPEL